MVEVTKENSKILTKKDSLYENILDKKTHLVDSLSSVYTKEEFQDKRSNVAWTEYLIEHKPEILEYKTILDSILNTGRVNSMTLEGEWKTGFVIQISDICLKFKNQDNTIGFSNEKKNYQLIQDIYNKTMLDQDLIRVPWLQRYLSNRDMIVMQYVPWFTLAQNFILKDKKIKENDLILVLQNQKWNDIEWINDRLLNRVHWEKEIMYNDLFEHLKDHELRSILIHMWVQEDEMMNVALLDTEFLIEFTMDKSIANDVRLWYKRWKNILSEHGIESLDDHWENLKIHNNQLYCLDFGNITFKKKYKK